MGPLLPFSVKITSLAAHPQVVLYLSAQVYVASPLQQILPAPVAFRPRSITLSDISRQGDVSVLLALYLHVNFSIASQFKLSQSQMLVKSGIFLTSQIQRTTSDDSGEKNSNP